MLTKDALERERYESRQKAIRDQMSLLREAQEQGWDEGRQVGRQVAGRRAGRRASSSGGFGFVSSV